MKSEIDRNWLFFQSLKQLQEIFNCKPDKCCIRLIKGRVYQQENSAGPYTFNVDNLEKSKFDYAFKVFGYAAEAENGSKIA